MKLETPIILGGTKYNKTQKYRPVKVCINGQKMCNIFGFFLKVTRFS